MCCMLFTTWPTTSPPRLATWAAVAASWLAWRAVSADWFTVPVSSSMLEAVCCKLEAVCSVRTDRSWLPLAISVEAVETASTPPRTSDTRPRSLPTISDRTRVSTPNSSLRCSSPICCVRSPAVMAWATATARASGCVIERTRSRTRTTLRPNSSAALTNATSWTLPRACSAACRASSRCFSCKATYLSRASRYCTTRGRNSLSWNSCRTAG